MSPKVIGIKKLHQHLPKIVQATLRGNSFIVLKHTKPVFRIEPFHVKRKKKYSLKDLRDLQFSHPDRNLSKKIDKIVYGI